MTIILKIEIQLINSIVVKGFGSKTEFDFKANIYPKTKRPQTSLLLIRQLVHH